MTIKKLFFILLFLCIVTLPLAFADNGGTITTTGGYIVHTFTSNGTYNVTNSKNIEVLVIGGGGAGGYSYGGGGGAGGRIFNGSYNVSAGGSYLVVIGGGGIATNVSPPYSPNGFNTTFNNLVAIGGGGAMCGGGTAGCDGGSGGGGTGDSYLTAGGNGVSGQGNNGGYSGKTAGGGGGGGGCNGLGQNASEAGKTGGNGGIGCLYNITGITLYYGCGGGGGGLGVGYVAGGSCGGGNGSNFTTGANAFNSRGGGGGGGSNNAKGGSGGSGVVIIRYPDTLPYANFTTPYNGTHNATSGMNFVFSCTAFPATYNLCVYLPSTPSSCTIFLSNASVLGTTISIYPPDGVYRAVLSCYDASKGLTSNNVSVTYFLDNTPPVVMAGFGNEWNLSNNYSLRDVYDGNFVVNLSFSDNVGLFGVQLYLYNSSGLYFNYTNVSLNGLTIWNYSNVVNVSAIKGFSGGFYNLSIEVVDTHTALAIDDYIVSREADSLVFDTAEGNLIKISSLEPVLEADAVKVDDRYSFGFTYAKEAVKPSPKPVSRGYVVESLSGGVVTYIKDSPYKAHFVIFNAEDFTGNWVDFEGVSGEPLVERLSDSKFSVTFNDIEPVFVGDEEVVVFESIGGLNTFNATYRVFIGNYTAVSPNTFTGENVNVALTLGRGVFNFSGCLLNIFGSLYSVFPVDYVGFSNVSTIVMANGSNGTFIYSYNCLAVNPDGSGFTSVLNASIVSASWGIGECGATPYNVSAINFSLFYETLPLANISGSLEVNLTAWISNVSNSKAFSLNYSNDDFFRVCVLNNTNLTIDLYAKDSAVGGFSHRFYLFNTSIYGGKSYSLYNFNNTAETSLLRLTMRDSDTYAYYPNVLGVLERWYIGDGLWRNVQYDLSDDYGLTLFDIVESSVDYRLKFYDKSNNLLKTTSNLKFSCDAGVCELIGLVSPFGVGVVSDALVVSHSYSNSTGFIYVDWVDNTSLVSSVRVMIVKSTITGELLLFNNTYNSSSGSASFNVSGVTGELMVRFYSSSSPESAFVSWWERLVGSNLTNVLGDGESAFWSFLVMVVIVFLGLVSPVASIIMSVVGLIALYGFGMFNVVSMSVVILAVVMGFALAFKIKR